MKPIADHFDYKLFLRSWIQAQPRSGRGLRSKLAVFLNCKPAFISQVINGPLDLSAEQAHGVARFMGLKELEAKYFRKMVEISRAGTSELKELLEIELREIRDQLKSTKERLEMETKLDLQSEIEYYSSWLFPAIHIALTIPGIDTSEKLAQAFRLPLAKVSTIVSSLISCGLISDTNGVLKVEKEFVHGNPRTPSARRHLINLRQKAIESAEFFDQINFHYSAVVSVSKDDLIRIRDILSESLQRSAQVIKVSNPSQVAILNIDWFTPAAFFNCSL